jgi:hypothetical protein
MPDRCVHFTVRPRSTRDRRRLRPRHQMLRDGNGEPQDKAEASAWLGKAAEQGNADAQNYLGVMLFFVQGGCSEPFHFLSSGHSLSETGG